MEKEANEFDFLLIDDNEIDLFLHERVIRLQGISSRIFPFPTAMRALDYLDGFRDKLDSYPSTVILLDLMMPEMDGFEFLGHLESLPPEMLGRTRIFIVSSSLDYGDMSRCEAHQLIENVLKKPLNGEELKTALEEITLS